MSEIMDVRRKAFESWVIREADKRKYAQMAYVISKNEDGSYLTTWVDCAWMGYNAALDSVCVELPGYPATCDMTSTLICETIDQCAKAIERAGLKVKP